MISLLRKLLSKKSLHVIAILMVTLFSFGPQSTNAQGTGQIRGRIIDAMTGDPLIGVTVLIQKERIYAVTDINGRYTLRNVPTGTHLVLYSMMGYARSSANISVGGGVKYFNVSLSYKTQKTVIVKAKRISSTTASLLNKRKKAPIAQDAISSEQISKSPDSDAGDAAKRIPGVTMVGNNVFVRGLGERYSSVMLAGSTIPSPDPEKRIVPLDIFPTGLLDNIVVKKAYTPDMPAEFGGGVVQINPKDYPEKFMFKFKLGTGYHSSTTFKTFHTYEGGKMDFFGFDDGTREKPSGIKSSDLSLSGAYTTEQLDAIKADFKNEYSPNTIDALMPLSFSFTLGNSYELDKNRNFGFLLTGMFKESSKTLNSKIKRYGDDGNILKDYDVDQSYYNTSKGMLLSLGYTTLKHKLRLTSFITHKSKDKTSILDGYNDDRQESLEENDSNKRYIMQYVETTLLFNQLYGEHRFANNIKVDWTGSFSWANRYEPDRRDIKLIDYNSNDIFELYQANDITRYFQEHDEYVYEFSPAITRPFKQWSGLRSSLKLGTGYSRRTRESSGRRFTYDGYTPLAPGSVLDPVENSLDVLPTMTEVSGLNNSYEGTLQLINGYAQLDLRIVKDLRLVGGVRYEYADATIKAFDSTFNRILKIDTSPYKKHNIAPGASVTYSLNDRSNLRAAFSKSIARPDFREITPGQYVTLIDDEVMHGNPDLKQSEIYNYDLRWEWFPSGGELIALSIFYKNIDKPIELLELKGTSGTAIYKYKNATSADNMGIELEIRKDFGFIAKPLKTISTLINVAYIYSKIELPDFNIDTAVITGDQQYTTKDRPLQGQSPYVINVGLNWSLKNAGFDSTLLFNINGKRIMRVGTLAGTPLIPENQVKRGDVYEQPAPKLDFVIKQKLASLNGELKLVAANLLNPEVKYTERSQAGSGGDYKTYTIYKVRKGMDFKISYTQKL